VIEPKACSVLDTPLEPVIGLAGGETRWRSMTASCEAWLFENRIGKLASATRARCALVELASRPVFLLRRQPPILSFSDADHIRPVRFEACCGHQQRKAAVISPLKS
jgi:hypothetical protein